MAKKKEKQQVINNIQELNLEIDYDKLAEAIVKAQKKSEDDVVASNKKVGFWKSIGLIITNKNPKNGKATAFLLAEIMSWFFNAVAVIGILFDIGVLSYWITTYQWTANIGVTITTIIYLILIFVTILMICLICRGIANELKAEKDREYIISVFSAFTGIAALVVALVALFKGVG